MPVARAGTRLWFAVLALLVGTFLLPVTARAASAPADPRGAQPVGPAPVAPDVQSQLDAVGTADFYVRFDAKADVSAAAGIADWTERGRYVVDQLKKTAGPAQAGVLADLDARHVEHRAFWIVNAVLVRGGDQETVTSLASRAEVSEIIAPTTYEIPEPQPGSDEPEIQSVEWGIANINADDVWSTFGDRGEGIVIANIDTGVQFDHPALVEQYRGNNGDGTFDHDYNWFDAAGSCGTAPCDGNGHGTHTMGTMVGDDGADNQIGVAPGATWITANGCCPSDAALLTSGEWMLEPTGLDGENPDVSKRPHIVSNSWGAPNLSAEDPFFVDIIEAWTAAGIFGAFANGNEGDDVPPPACDTTGSPADAPEAYGVGAYDINNNIAVFSSRGPGGEGELKPNISAPGVNVRSSFPGDTYGSISGTSMSTPHLAAAVALMWSAAPSLIGDVEATRLLLDDTALDTEELSCGGTADDNNVFGEGRLDAFAAVDASPRGDAGTLTGTVTGDETGAPIAGADVLVEGGPVPRTTTTGPDGVYSIVLSAGEYDVTVSAYGYEPATQSVTVPAGETTTLDFELVALPRATVSGTVTDGSGHGWPLYARIDIDGYPNSPVFTDPITGEYSVELVESTPYTFTVTAESAGYEVATRDITVPPDPVTQDFALTADPTCTAPGYAFGVDGLYESFDTEELPAGWEVVDNVGNGQVWRFDDPGGQGNLTGGEGGFADIDSDFFGSAGEQDTELISTSADLSDVDEPVIRFNTDFNAFSTEIADVDLSIDGGTTWTNVWQAAGEGGGGDLRGPRVEQIEIPEAAGESDVQVRFHYYDAVFEWWWQVDNVLVGAPACVVVPGGLVAGNVTDGLTGVPLNDATVASDDAPEDTATTRATPDDPNVDDGFYQLFSSFTGTHPFTASKNQYGSLTADVDVVADDVVRQDFALPSGHLVVEPASIEETLDMGATTDIGLTITNDGDADASFELSERDLGFEILSQPSGPPARRESGIFSPLRFDPERLGSAPADPAAGPSDAPWEDIADYDRPIMDNLVDSLDGLVYSVGGFDGANNIAEGFAYDPAIDSWSSIADMAFEREKPTGAFVDGLFYVTGGWDNAGGDTVAALEIYDPSTDAWISGADWPSPMSAAAGVALDGKLYTIGGCTDTCGSEEVWIYDTATDSWSQAADYPEPTSWSACGAIGGLIYCGGGTAGNSELDTAYVYDPAGDAWTAIADLPETRWAAGFVAANDQLLVSGGVTNNFQTVTNEGFAYDPGTDTWTPLANSNNTVYRGGSACGFYKIGGSVGGFSPIPASEVLPGFDQCGAPPDVPWLSLDPVTGTVPPGGSVTVTVTLDASVPEVDQPGAYSAAIRVSEDTPHNVAPVPVTMNVTPPATWGKLEGTVVGLERCDVEGGPLSGATVVIDGTTTDFTLTTDAAGHYAVWMDEANAPLTITASKGGWVTLTHSDVDINAGETTVDDFTLRLDQPCASVSPEVLELTDTTSAELTLSNDGAAPYDFAIAETPFGLEPLDEAPAFSQPAEVGPLSVRSTDVRTGAGPAVGRITPQAIDSWFGGADVPGGRVRYGATQCDGDPNHFYIFSGVDGGASVTDSSMRYDATTNEWTELAPIPEAGEGPSAACEAGRIHVVGGDGTNRHFIYSIASDTWEAAAPLPRNVWGAAMAGWDGHIYVAGGDSDFFSGGTSPEVDVYDIATGEWEVLDEAMPTAAVAPGKVQAGQYLYVVGGWGDGTPGANITATQRLNLDTGEWESGSSFASARGDLALAATDTAIYAIGGDASGGGFFDATVTVERLAVSDFGLASWTPYTSLQIPLVANSGGFCSEAIFGQEIWTGSGATAGPQILGRTFFHGVSGEVCPTIRSDVPWLTVDPSSGTVPADDSVTVDVNADAADLEPGIHEATLLITTTDAGAPEIRVPVTLTVGAEPPAIFVSLGTATTIGAIAVDDEDVIGFNPGGFASVQFDGSDVGLGGLAIDAFANLGDGSLVLSFTEPGSVPGVSGTVDDSDLVKFVPTSLGPDTAGTFELWFDGSDVALATAAEDVDAVDVLDDGKIVLSTVGAANLGGGLLPDDSDLVAFTPTSLGANTAGSYAWYVDGSDVGLTTDDEDVDATAVGADGGIALSSLGALAVAGLNAEDDDVVTFRPTALGSTTTGTFDPAPTFDGSAHGLTANDVTGVELP